jgi:hypothetical protein
VKTLADTLHASVSIEEITGYNHLQPLYRSSCAYTISLENLKFEVEVVHNNNCDLFNHSQALLRREDL